MVFSSQDKATFNSQVRKCNVYLSVYLHVLHAFGIFRPCGCLPLVLDECKPTGRLAVINQGGRLSWPRPPYIYLSLWHIPLVKPLWWWHCLLAETCFLCVEMQNVHTLNSSNKQGKLQPRDLIFEFQQHFPQLKTSQSMTVVPPSHFLVNA